AWNARSSRRGGAPRPPLTGGGVLRIDLQTAKVTEGKTSDRPPEGAINLAGRVEAKLQLPSGIELKQVQKPIEGRPTGGSQPYLQGIRDGKVLWERPMGQPHVLSLPVP